MVVTEEEDIDGRGVGSGALCVERLAELVERLLLPFEGIADALSQPGFPRPSVPEPEGEPGMEGAEAGLEEAVVEDAPENPVAPVHGSESVPMPEAEGLSADF